MEQETEIYPFDEWNKALAYFQSINMTEAKTVYDELIIAYSSKYRAYHNLNHITQMLKSIKELINVHVIDDKQHVHAQLIIATFFHDVIYDLNIPMSKRIYGNEELSSEYAIQALRKMNVQNLSDIQTIGELIRITETHKVNEASVVDPVIQKIFIDADMSIFAEDDETYEEYASNIRKEYNFADDESFRTGRMNFLNGVIKGSIFLTSYMRKVYYDVAVHNISMELASLQ